MNIDLSVALNSIVVRCDHLFASQKKIETGLGSEKKKVRLKKREKKIDAEDKRKKRTSRQIFYMRHFFTLQKNVCLLGLHMRSTTQALVVPVCVCHRTDQSMGSCFFIYAIFVLTQIFLHVFFFFFFIHG